MPAKCGVPQNTPAQTGCQICTPKNRTLKPQTKIIYKELKCKKSETPCGRLPTGKNEGWKATTQQESNTHHRYAANELK